MSLTSVQIYIQIVPLCDFNDNNIRKQIHMASEHGQQVSKDKVYASKRFVFNLTRTLFFESSGFQTFKCSIQSVATRFV